jgi:hypothetical protein
VLLMAPTVKFAADGVLTLSLLPDQSYHSKVAEPETGSQRSDVTQTLRSPVEALKYGATMTGS